jgi:RimJ/RimL family protein N-acetyltransferase
MVVIREKRIEDVADDYSWRTDEELSRLDATLPLRMSFSEFSRFSREEIRYDSSASRRLAIDTLDGHHIGNCMYYDVDLKRGETELGIMIGDRDYWDKGYGTDSVDALLGHIFTATPLSRVYLHTLESNTRAQRCFAKSGFREVKKVRRSGLDFLQMDIHRADWERLSRNGGSADSAEEASGPSSPEEAE